MADDSIQAQRDHWIAEANALRQLLAEYHVLLVRYVNKTATEQDDAWARKLLGKVR